MHFTDLPLPATLMAGIQQTGFTTLTPIQEQTLPLQVVVQIIALMFGACWAVQVS